MTSLPGFDIIDSERLAGNAAFADGRFEDARATYKTALDLWQQQKEASSTPMTGRFIILAAKCLSNLTQANLNLGDQHKALDDAGAGIMLLEDPLLKVKLTSSEWELLAPIKRKLLYRKGIAMDKLCYFEGAVKMVERSLAEWEGAKPALAHHTKQAREILPGMKERAAKAVVLGRTFKLGAAALHTPARKTPPTSGTIGYGTF